MSFAKNLPNIITFSRIISSLLMVIFYFFKLPLYAEVLFLLFVVAGVSDFFDGYLSRKWNVVSNLGKCLDPISDKLLLITALLILTHAGGVNFVFAFLIIAREVIISGLREFLSLSKIELPVSRLAKWKTATQLIAVSMCFFVQSHHLDGLFLTYLNFFPLNFITLNIVIISKLFITLAVILTLYTGLVYILHSTKYLKG
jgi:cardiolipin synthase